MLALALTSTAAAMPFDSAPPACEQVFPPTKDLEVFVVTMGPGAEPFSLLGHTAVWVRDPRHRRDHVYNFGTFDSSRQNPAYHVVMGSLECRWEIRTRNTSLSRYRARDRTMIAQRIDLPQPILRQFVRELDVHARGDNPWARFHWLDNSCATQVRDLLDSATDGVVREQLADTAPLSARGEVTRHLESSWPIWLAWHHVAGPWTDRDITTWDATFMPERLSEALSTMTYDGAVISPQVCTLYQGGTEWPQPDPPRRAPVLWAFGIGAGITLAGLSTLGTRSRLARVLHGLNIALFGLVAGLLGSIHVVLAAVSDLQPAFGPSENWLVASPLTLSLVAVGLTWALGRRPAWTSWIAEGLAALAVVAMAIQVLPFLTQVNIDVLGIFVPVLVAIGLHIRITERTTR
jgi:hypothetical protein